MIKMKKLLLFILFLSVRSLFGQTYISGFISTNTTWSAAGSPYIVTGNTLVMLGSTLTIQPGVIILFDSSKTLQVDGKLIAIGTNTDHITFSSNQPIPSTGDWGNIHFSDKCESALLDSSGNYISGTIMKYCDVLYAGAIGFGAIHIITSSPFFNHCNISYSASDGIYSMMTTYNIDSSTISHCQGSGLHFDRYYQNFCSQTIKNDSLLDNGSGGVNFDGYFSFMNCNFMHYTNIRNNVFEGNSPYALIIRGDQYDSLVVAENIFENNSGSEATLSFAVTTYAIACNKFINNNNSKGVLLSNEGDHYNSFTSSYYIQDNLIQNNVAGPGNDLIYIFNKANSKNVYFCNNLVNGNSVSSGNILSLKSTVTNVLQVHHNEFSNNQAQNCISLGIQDGNPGSLFTYCDIRYNNLTNPGCTYEFYNDVPYGGPNITADSIYWGSTSIQHIDSVIYDYFDYANQSVVFYQPILNFATEYDTTCKVLSIGLNELHQSKFSSQAFPNPFSKSTTIQFTHELRNATFSLYNLYGQSIKVENYDSIYEINFSRENIPDGIYFYSLIEKNMFMSSGKLIIN
jgi:hypothetical protein